MSHSQRYFLNKMADYSDKETVSPNHETIKTRISEYLSVIGAKQELDDCDGGPYVGVAGVAYTLVYLASQSHLFNSEERKYFEKEVSRYLSPALTYANKHEKSSRHSLGYLLGFAGVYCVAVLFFHLTGDESNRDLYLEKYIKLAPKVLPENYLPKGSDELLVGRAGYICGANVINRFLQKKAIPDETLLRIGYSSVSSGLCT